MRKLNLTGRWIVGGFVIGMAFLVFATILLTGSWQQ
jgi:hypothetical protein